MNILYLSGIISITSYLYICISYHMIIHIIVMKLISHNTLYRNTDIAIICSPYVLCHNSSPPDISCSISHSWECVACKNKPRAQCVGMLRKNVDIAKQNRRGFLLLYPSSMLAIFHPVCNAHNSLLQNASSNARGTQ